MTNDAKRKRSVSKLQKGVTAEGAEYYYSRKPSSKSADYANEKTKPLPAKARKVIVKNKKT